MDYWINGLMDEWIHGLMSRNFGLGRVSSDIIRESELRMEYTKRRNLNRGYMKLDVWQRGMDLFEQAFKLASSIADFKLRSQFTDAAQSAPANVAEGYGRRSLPEYIQFLYIAKGSLAESLTRACGLRRGKLISEVDFENFDKLHYEAENKLLALISSLEMKRANYDWRDALPQ
jgi:four helix bundle protein